MDRLTNDTTLYEKDALGADFDHDKLTYRCKYCKATESYKDLTAHLISKHNEKDPDHRLYKPKSSFHQHIDYNYNQEIKDSFIL